MFFILIFFFSFSFETIILKYKTEKPIINPNNDTETFISLSRNNIYTFFNIGNPTQIIKTYIRMMLFQYYFLDKTESNYYNKNISKTIEIKRKEYFISSNFQIGYSIKENFLLETENKSNIIAKLDTTIAENTTNIKEPGLIGFNFAYFNDDPYTNFIKELKSKNYIDSYLFSIEYINKEEEGEIIIGNYSHKNYNYKEENFKFSKIDLGMSSMIWNIYFNKIFIGNEKFEQNLIADLLIEEGLINAPLNYREMFLNTVYNKSENLNKCFETKNLGNIYYKCDEDTNIKDLPPLTFISYDLNQTFILTYEDLFYKSNGKLYFLVYFNTLFTFWRWKLGKPFFKKYKLFFNQDKYLVGIYKDDNKFNWKIVIILILSLTILLIVGFIIVQLKKFRRRRRKNEIDDYYEYIEKI